ncbi:hypothetical protein [Enterococcus innesii]|uniref:hypothetical protein n=1 Tax=Enterococcus innesii TaxID=2839759 RepID=UPI0032E3C56B
MDIFGGNHETNRSCVFRFVGSVFLLSDKGAASQIERTDEINFSVQNIDTGEYVNENVELTYEVPSLRSSMITDGNVSEEKSYVSEFEIEFTPEDETDSNMIKPFASNDDETNSTEAVKVLARITYTKSGYNIKVTSASSKFTLTSSFASVSSRNLKVQQGFTNALERTSTSNSLTTYNTGWGYVYNYGGAATAKTTISGTVTMSGMASYRVSATASRL